MPSDDLLIVERAYELAASGRCTSVKEIRARLKAERFTAAAISAHFAGLDLRRRLKAVLKKHGEAPQDAQNNA